MKISSIEFRGVRIFYIAMTLSIIALSVQAQEKSSSLKLKMQQLDKAESVMLLINKPLQPIASGSEPSPRPSRESRQAFSCQYMTHQTKQIQQMLAIINKESMKNIAEVESHLPIVQASIYFTFDDGSETEILLGQEYLSEYMIAGEIRTSDNKVLNIQANNSEHRLYRALFKWANNVEMKRAGDFYYIKPEISQQQKGWIRDGLKFSNNSYEEELKRRQQSEEEFASRRLLDALQNCDKLTAIEYYQTSPSQRCRDRHYYESGSFYITSPGYCSAGWE